MVLYLIGLGLGDERDITVRGLETVRTCKHIFLEAYTSVLRIDKAKLESFYEREITIADRNFVEGEADKIYLPAKDDDVALLVVGDPVCATTHGDIIVRAQEVGVEVEIIHNASVMGAVGCCGLQLYNFGQTVSVPYFDENWRPTSFYPKIKYNRGGGMHTLCLLDIKVKEPDFNAMMKGKTVFLPPRYMSVNTALEQLIEVEERLKEEAYGRDTLCVGMSRLGQEDQCIIAGTMEELLKEDFGEPLHSLAICGDVHDMEIEFLKQFMVKGSVFLSSKAS